MKKQFDFGDVIYPNGTVIRSQEWSSDHPIATPIGDVEEEVYPDVSGINPNPKYYVMPKNKTAEPKTVKVKIKKTKRK